MYNDLSEIHAPLSDLFRSSGSRAVWEKLRLAGDDIAFFNKNGYLNNIKLLEDWQADALKAELNAITDPLHPGNALFYEFNSNESADPDQVLFHALGAWRITPGFHDILWNPAFLVPASQLLGDRSVRFWHDQLFCKPARHGGVVAWHQDYSYWTRTTPIQHLTCWIALDDATVDNGCLQYVPGSHQWGLLDKPELAGDMDAILNYLTPQQKNEFKPIPVEMKKGFASFHHPLLLHGSGRNNSEHARRATVLNVFADGTVSATNEQILNGVPAIHAGETMQGQYFPLLFDLKNVM